MRTAANPRKRRSHAARSETTRGTASREASGVIQIGEAFVGSGPEAAHVNTVLGPREGPVGTAWATALATPSAGHAPFVAVVRPGLPAQPLTLFVNKAAIAGEGHGRLTWGAAQAGVASGVLDAVAAGAIDAAGVDRLALIAAVWVDPAARDAEAVYRNNREATARALAAGRDGDPPLAAVLEARHAPRNPFFEPGS
jgi:5,6,7,8-tetrahydromethanopterin hydro-lyase